MATESYHFPEFDLLPEVDGQPQGCLWGFFDQGLRRDELGTLNLLTASAVVKARDEIRCGTHVQLDWNLEGLRFPGCGRIGLTHRVVDLRSEGLVALDDEIHFNTQNSSQWDSLKHWAVQSKGIFYNNLSFQEAQDTPRNGFHSISTDQLTPLEIPVAYIYTDVCQKGGIVGRGVLADWVRWWELTRPEIPLPQVNSPHAIPISEIEEVLNYQNTTPRQGDILFLRTGYIRWYNQADETSVMQEAGGNIGLESNMDSVRWLYSKHFAAVAADNLAFEAEPAPGGNMLHDWLLGYWGTPIGELFDLEGLSQECERQKRWSFFLTSAPLNVTGGVASPPNAIAIF
ncbi:unnamed protein product [Clonostachys byssicola]|uniref:Cyclase n=1 Tax=Clonostachys byssicola TaxID=160290 RepID=A0A9N9Y7L7_9HYPO|nr:unnamed protein product [Clonostachys byssicola]